MPLTQEEKDHLTGIAKGQAAIIVEKMRGAAPAEEIQKSVVPSIAYPPSSAPTIITKRDEDERFSFCRLFKALSQKDENLAPFEMDIVHKAQNRTTDTAGGYLVPHEYSPEIIELLQAKSVFRMLGGSVEPMSRAVLDVPKITGGVTATYTGESATLTDTQGTFGMERLIARELTCLVKVSNGWLQDAGPIAERKVREMIGKAIALKENQSFLTGSGGVEPLGLINMPNVNTLASVAAGTLDYDYLINMQTAAKNAESEITGFLTTPSVEGLLRKLKDSNNRYIWEPAIQASNLDRLLGRPATVSTTANNPDTTTTHYIIGCDWDGEVVIGERMSLEFSLSTDRYFEQNITAIRAIARHDMIVRHQAAIQIQPVTGVS